MSSHTLAQKKSVTIPGHLLAEVQSRAGTRGLSAYVTRALTTQLELDRLDDYLAVAERVNGPVSQAMMDQVNAAVAAAHEVAGRVR